MKSFKAIIVAAVATAGAAQTQLQQLLNGNETQQLAQVEATAASSQGLDVWGQFEKKFADPKYADDRGHQDIGNYLHFMYDQSYLNLLWKIEKDTRDEIIETCYHFGLKRPDMSLAHKGHLGTKGDEGADAWINFDNWVLSLSCIAHYSDKEGSPDVTTYVYKTMADSNRSWVDKINYRQSLLFSTTGGSSGSKETTVTVNMGRSSETKLSAEVMGKVENNWPIGVSADVGFNVSAAKTANEYYNEEVEETFHLDLSMPLYMYQREVEIIYKDGHSDTISTGIHITDHPEAFNETTVV